MKTILNRALFFAVVWLTVVLCLTKTAVADDLDIDSEDGQSVEIHEALMGFLFAYGYDFNKEYYCSNAYKIWGSDVPDNIVFFVFCENRCIGELVYSSRANASSFYQEHCEIVTELANQECPIVACSGKGGGLCIVSSEGSFCLWGEDIIDDSFFNTESLEKCAITIRKKRISFVLYGSRHCQSRLETDESSYLSVPVIANATSPDTEVGLCWLASILSMLQYSNKAYGHTTLSLYYYVKMSVYVQNEPYPRGITPFIEGTFGLFNYPVSFTEAGMTFDSVKTVINTGKPIWVALMTSDLLDAHAVVLCGYRAFSHTGAFFYRYYRLMDPNCTNYVTVSVSGTGTNFTYDNGGTIYSLWTSNYK